MPTSIADFRRIMGLPEPSISRIERDMDQGKPHLRADRRTVRREARRRLVDARQIKTAAEALGKLPEPGEGVHMLLSGRFALLDFTEAVLALAGCKIVSMHLATLGFSRRNVTRLCNHVDSGTVGRVTLLFSHYFRGTSAKLSDFADAEFGKRPERMRLASLRTHCKLLLFDMEDGQKLSLESSANARSCRNLENCTAFGDPLLYEFHRTWIDELFSSSRN